MLISNIFIYKSFYEKKNLQDIIVVEIVKIQMHSQSTWYFGFKFF